MKDQPVTKTTNTTNPAWLTNASQTAATEGTNLPLYQPYSGQGVAPLVSNQLAALRLAQGNTGLSQAISMGAQPGFTNAMNYTAPQVTGASIGSNIQGLLSPYAQSNVDAVNAQLDRNNAIGTSNLNSTLAGQGAFGGSRQAVADAEMANQNNMTKASTDAGIYNGDYSSALSTALAMGQGNQNAANYGASFVNLPGANALAGLGTTIGGQNTNDISGLLTTGGLQQATGQAQDTFNVGQYTQAQQSPYQQAGTLAQILGSVPHDQTNTQTQDVYSNPLLGIAGLGLGIAGLGTGGGATLGGTMLNGLLGNSFNWNPTGQ